jgi:hypothetical protein
VMRSLDRAGRLGRQAAELADRTAPSVVRTAETHPSGTPRSGAPGDTGDTGTAPVGRQVASAVVAGSGGGLGIALPLVLAASLVCAVGFALSRRRRSR